MNNIFNIASMLFSDPKSLDVIVPRNLKQSTLSLGSPLILMGAIGFLFFLKINDHLPSFGSIQLKIVIATCILT